MDENLTDVSLPLKDRFSFLAHRINAQLTRICNPMFKKWNVDIDMARMLVMLRQQGEMNVGEMVDFMALPQSTVSYQIKRLEKLGYVERISSKSDSRIIVSKLTEAGADVADQSNKLSRDITSVIVEAITDMDNNALRIGMQRIDDALSALRAVDPIGKK